MDFKEAVKFILIFTISVFAGTAVAIKFAGPLAQALGGGSSSQTAFYHALGTPTASSSLSAQFASTTRTFAVQGLENLHLDIRYEPRLDQVNRYAMVLIEVSNDGGVNWFPMSSKVVGTDEIDLYVTSTLQGTNFNNQGGLPIIIPGNKISTGSTTYHGFDDYDIVASHVRISARESGTANFGNIYVGITVTSKN